jgi:thiol-disulfide isomerase/thioredoxin
MKHYFSIAILTIFLSNTNKLSAQIIINGRSNDDGSKTLAKEDSLSIHPFCLENVGKTLSINTKSEIYFELINSEQLGIISKKNKYTWVFIQSSWCGACSLVLKKYVKIADSLKSEGVNLVVINQDMNIKNLKKKIKMENYNTLTYIINPTQYGINEAKKQEKFIQEVSGDYKLNEYSPNSVPQAFFLDQNGNMIFFEKSHSLTKSFIEKNIIKQ